MLLAQGKPEDLKNRLPREQRVYEFLERLELLCGFVLGLHSQTVEDVFGDITIVRTSVHAQIFQIALNSTPHNHLVATCGNAGKSQPTGNRLQIQPCHAVLFLAAHIANCFDFVHFVFLLSTLALMRVLPQKN